MMMMGRWQPDLSAPPDFANRRAIQRELAGNARVAARLSHDSQPVDDNFPLWTESRIRSGGIWPIPGIGSIPAFALGRYSDFSTDFSPGALMSLILASNSQIRRLMLEQAGVEFEVRSPDFDEDSAKRGHRGDGESLARRLAEGKALSIAAPATMIG